MSGGRHTSSTPEHYTPASLVQAAREVLGVDQIALDPASCAVAQETVLARRWLASVEGCQRCAQPSKLSEPHLGCSVDPQRDWGPGDAVLLNPPGDRSGHLVRHFWERAIREACERRRSIFWVGFSLNQLRTLQIEDVPHPLDCPTVIPRRRVPYESTRLVVMAARDGRWGLTIDGREMLLEVRGDVASIVCESFRNEAMWERGRWVLDVGHVVRGRWAADDGSASARPQASPSHDSYLTLVGGADEQIARLRRMSSGNGLYAGAFVDAPGGCIR